MKILVVASMVPRRGGGGAIPVLLFAELVGLSRRHEITLVTSLGDEPGEAEAVVELEHELPEVRLHCIDRRQPPTGPRRWRRRLRLAATWVRRRWPWRTVWFADPGIQAVLDRLSAAEAFDVVAVEDGSMAVFGLPRDLPAVLTQNEVLRPGRLEGEAGRLWRSPASVVREVDWRRWQSFQREAWRRFDLIQVYSAGDAEAVAELAPDVAPRVRVNPFGIVIPEAADPDREVPGTVLFVGHFAHPPNRDAALWLALEIMPAVRASHPQARLRIVGTAPPREVLELRGATVEVVADAPSVEPHLAAASVVAAPVRTGGGMRMKVLQALAAGKAVVTTTLGAEGYSALEREPPFVVADGDEEIAEATAALLGDAARRRDLGRRAREFAQRHHDPEAWASRLEAVYAEARENRLEAARG